MPTEDLQESGSQPQNVESKDLQQTPEPSATEGALNDAQLKSGMLDAINKELDSPEKDVKAKDKEDQVETVVDTNKEEVKAKKPSDKKQSDEELYNMPEGLQKESQKRFQRLVDVAKEATAKVEEVQRSAKVYEDTITNFRAILEETKTSSEDLNGLLEYNKMVKTGDLEGAMRLLDEQRTMIGRYLGRPIDGVDYLDGYDDLKMAVEEGKITPSHAAELAKARNVSTVFRQEQDRVQKENETHNQKQQQVNSAIESISKFAAEKSESDIDYKKKEELLLNAVDKISNNFPPHLWLSQIEMLYETLSNIQPPAPTRSPAPLRPNAGGGGKPQAKSMADAISQGLGYSSVN